MAGTRPAISINDAIGDRALRLAGVRGHAQGRDVIRRGLGPLGGFGGAVAATRGAGCAAVRAIFEGFGAGLDLWVTGPASGSTGTSCITTWAPPRISGLGAPCAGGFAARSGMGACATGLDSGTAAAVADGAATAAAGTGRGAMGATGAARSSSARLLAMRGSAEPLAWACISSVRAPAASPASMRDIA